MSGFDYIESEPCERFRIPDRTDPIGAAAALLSFASYPLLRQMQDRQLATDAFRAWIFRQAIKHGVEVKPPRQLSRKQLPPALMRARVYRAARRFEFDGLDIAAIGQEISFRRSDCLNFLAKGLATYFKAEAVSLSLPKNYTTDTHVFRQYLRERRSARALRDNESAVIKDFRRRTWEVFLPALPLLAAIHFDILKFDPTVGDYGLKLPGHGKRYLAISLISNPDAWISSVVRYAMLRRFIMAESFPKNAFAEILSEDLLG